MVLLKVNRSCFLTMYNSVILFRIAAMSNPSYGLYSPQSSLVTQIFQIHFSPFGRDRLCCSLHMGPPLSCPKMILKVKIMQKSGNEAIRNQIQHSKPKREITEIQIVKIQREHMTNRASSYFPKGGHSATQTKLKII